MNKTLISATLASGLLAATAALPALAGHEYRANSAGHARGHLDYARVTHVEPIYRTISHRVPERSCRTETRYEAVDRGYRSHTPAVLGTLIGGAIGNEVGHNKSNKRVGTVVGAVLGASLARDWSHGKASASGYSRPVSEEVCEINERLEYEEKIVGYDVSYRYQGQEYRTRMDHYPGKKIKVAVNVAPVY